MKKNLFFMALSLLIVFSACKKEENLIDTHAAQTEYSNVEENHPLNGTPIPGQYIIVLSDDAVEFESNQDIPYKEKLSMVREYAQQILSRNAKSEFEVLQTFAHTLKGFSVKMSLQDIENLGEDGDILYIEQDMHIMRPPTDKKPGGGKPSDNDDSGQEVPYGITRVGTGDGTGLVAWIIDSGIDLDHPDLNVDVNRSVDYTGSNKGADDENGHGTHCAGTVAAIDNNIGVVGVAAGATVVAVKVLNRRGSGSTSGVIAGVDYVAATAAAGDAANMSLGGGISTTLDNAVASAAANGIYFALAAGNESDDAIYHSPARVNGANIWTISAMDSNDQFASFSNYGSPVDYCEPGVNIESTYKNGGYKTISGTSMAAPHMCGILLLTGGNPTTDGYVNGDPDGNADPIGHK